MAQVLLKAENLSKHFSMYTRTSLFGGNKSIVKAVDHVSFQVQEGSSVAIVGESGCGKTTLMRLLIRLLNVTEGKINFLGEDVTSLSGKQLNMLRRNMQIVFQDPLSSLNPVMTIRDILSEPLITHTDITGEALHKRVTELLELVGLSGDHLWRRPHEFSGGQCQRITIARALALNPRLVILDEPTASLDVSVQALILKLLYELQQQFKLTYLFVTHNLSVARCMADEMIVMYMGRVVEKGAVKDVFDQPLHPYTKLLLSSIPSPVPGETLLNTDVLESGVPSAVNVPVGCRFHPRCPEKIPLCLEVEPEPYVLPDGRQVSCLLYQSKWENRRGENE